LKVEVLETLADVKVEVLEKIHLNLTPKALANFSPGFERSEKPWVLIPKDNQR
jgi:hypothetical protein